MYHKTRITSKYQITIPKKLRKRLNVERGDRVVFEEFKGMVTVKVEKKIDPVEAIDGILEGAAIGDLKSKVASRMLKRKLGMA